MLLHCNTDLLVNRRTSGVKSIRRIAANPVLIAIVLGTVSNGMDFSVPQPMLSALDFAGAAAASPTLFALGVILTVHTLKFSSTIATMSALKLVEFPPLV